MLVANGRAHGRKVFVSDMNVSISYSFNPLWAHQEVMEEMKVVFDEGGVL